jgi:hypothetical protein
MSRINKYSQMAVLAFFTVLSLTGCNLVLRKISGTLPTNGDVSESVTFRLSPDGLWAIYIADPFTDGPTPDASLRLHRWLRQSQDLLFHRIQRGWYIQLRKMTPARSSFTVCR